MKKGNVFTTIGLLIYLVVSIIDRLVMRIADYIYIPIMIIGLLLLIIGIIQSRRNK